MDKPSGTAIFASLVHGALGFNFPGWINHPEPVGSLALSAGPVAGFNFPGWINHPELQSHTFSWRSFYWFQLPRMDKPSGTCRLATLPLLAAVFQLPRMDKPSGTRRPGPGRSPRSRFNFPGWINHPERCCGTNQGPRLRVSTSPDG